MARVCDSGYILAHIQRVWLRLDLGGGVERKTRSHSLLLCRYNIMLPEKTSFLQSTENSRTGNKSKKLAGTRTYWLLGRRKPENTGRRGLLVAYHLLQKMADALQRGPFINTVRILNYEWHSDIAAGYCMLRKFLPGMPYVMLHLCIYDSVPGLHVLRRCGGALEPVFRDNYAQRTMCHVLVPMRGFCRTYVFRAALFFAAGVKLFVHDHFATIYISYIYWSCFCCVFVCFHYFCFWLRSLYY